MNQQQILHIFEKTGALLKGHFRLTSGLHSDTYFQCALVLQHPQYAYSLSKLIAENFKNTQVDTVISPAIGGIVVGQEVGRQLKVRSLFAEREGEQMQLRRGFSLEAGERILVCEDVVTTGGSVFEVIELVKSNGAELAGVGYIVDRSNGKINFNTPQYPCVKLDVKTFLPDECPLCKRAIPLTKPGSRKL